jgi:signal transduction histidine kinase
MGAPQVASRFDIALACGLALLGVVEVAVPFSTVMGDGSPWLAGSVAVGTALALSWRRSHPVAVVAVVMLPWAALSVLVPLLVLFWGALAPMCVALYSVARYGVGRAPYVGAAIGAGALVLFMIGTDMIGSPSELFFPWLVLSAAWSAGYLVHRKELVARTSERRARDAETQGREQTLAALAEERARIARELHDIVAHTVTAIVVEAGAAEQVVEEDPDYVRRSLERIRRTGSEALDEMRRVVPLLRVDGVPEPVGPQPGLADVGAMVERSCTPGTRVRLQVTGERRSLPPGADLTAYRIVQESLTNVRRHAAASEVTVAVRYGPASVELEISDNGVGRPHPDTAVRRNGDGTGHGLIGMQERVSIYGGRLEVDSAPGAGFRVCASLPLEEVS